MQPYFFPNIGYYQLLNYVDIFIIYDDVNYINRGWIDRNYINFFNEKIPIKIPLVKKSQNKLISNTEILNNDEWKTNIIQKLSLYYKANTNFKENLQFFQDILFHEDKNLANFLTNSINKFAERFSINTQIKRSSELKNNKSLSGEEKILEICKIINASEYINLYSGSKLYTKKNFEKSNLKLSFIKTLKSVDDDINYSFSIIDLIFKNSFRLNKHLNNFELV